MRRWIQAWPGGALIGVGNGIAREATYGKVLGEQAALPDRRLRRRARAVVAARRREVLVRGLVARTA